MNCEDLENLLYKICSKQDYDLFNRKFSYIYKNIVNSMPDEHIIDKTINAMVLFKHKKFEMVISFIEIEIKELLWGRNCSYDIFIAKILRLYYLARKYSGLNNDIFFNLLVSNKEFNNKESVSVITNCLLDYMLCNDVYFKMENEISQSELGIYNFYNGIIELVEGNYNKAYDFFRTAKMSRETKKYIILTKLLQSNFQIDVEYDKRLEKYFKLVKIIKQADMNKFLNFVNENKEFFMLEKLFFIVMRLSHNVIQEKIRCASLIYSKISFTDLSFKLDMYVDDLEYILKKSIKNGLITGYVKNQTYYNNEQTKSIKKQNKLQFADLLNINNKIKGELKYPKNEVPCYGNVRK
ncbi:26s proteasome regulatory subunit [Vairimorpha apis BRL 01]|uniref:26s proteasome regulatory subunit n=1 Tax=Vairimorpha apis BRL 01 TaxID=1037528 RepID=T0MGY3_9MICR|nr:26s proteasome regulatory subunit [Vairimorpha apis BRL 01]